MISKRFSFPSVYVERQNSIYVFGGHDGVDTIKKCEMYDLEKDEWTPIADLNKERIFSSAIQVGHKKIYVIGGNYE